MNSFRVYGIVVDTFRKKYHEDALLEWEKLHDEWVEADQAAKEKRADDDKARLRNKGLAQKV